jgi:hypothetical protein
MFVSFLGSAIASFLIVKADANDEMQQHDDARGRRGGSH